MAKTSTVTREDASLVVQSLPSLKKLSGTTILISGASGFLCSFILDVLADLNNNLDRAVKVLALDNFSTGLSERVEHLKDDPNFGFIAQDVTKRFTLERPVNWIVHGASIASPTFYRRFPLETIDANTMGTRNLLDIGRSNEISGFLQLSSSEIYGDPDEAFIPTSEDYVGRVSCTGPRACYDESKRLGETLALTYFRLWNLPVKIVRPFNVYGPGQRLDDARIIPDMMAAALEGRPIVLFGDGRATRAFCYLSDFVTGLLAVLLDAPAGEAYNVGNDAEIAVGDAAELMCKVAANGITVERHVSADPQYLVDNPQRRCPNLNKVTVATGWRPRITLPVGLERTLRSYREQQVRA